MRCETGCRGQVEVRYSRSISMFWIFFAPFSPNLLIDNSHPLFGTGARRSRLRLFDCCVLNGLKIEYFTCKIHEQNFNELQKKKKKKPHIFQILYKNCKSCECITVSPVAPETDTVIASKFYRTNGELNIISTFLLVTNFTVLSLFEYISTHSGIHLFS